jgi:hypothetical protein
LAPASQPARIGNRSRNNTRCRRCREILALIAGVIVRAIRIWTPDRGRDHHTRRPHRPDRPRTARAR